MQGMGDKLRRTFQRVQEIVERYWVRWLDQARDLPTFYPKLVSELHPETLIALSVSAEHVDSASATVLGRPVQSGSARRHEHGVGLLREAVFLKREGQQGWALERIRRPHPAREACPCSGSDLVATRKTENTLVPIRRLEAHGAVSLVVGVVTRR